MIRRLPRLALLVAISIVAGGAPATAQQPGPAAAAAASAAPDPRIPFEKYTLDNGLEVILVEDRTVPLVAVSVWYHVGSGHEVPGRSGFAHLFEHMLFQGSAHVGDDRHFAVLKEMGASSVNGTTSYDRTNYFEVVPSNQLEAALWLESDRMGYLLPKLSAPSLANQIDVVRNERRQRIDNVPYGKTSMVLAEMLYPEGHPYRYRVIGRHEDLEAATLDDVRAFYRTWYVPANATLALAGDLDPAEARRLVAKWFGSFPASTRPAVVPVPAPRIAAQRREVTDDFAQLRQVRWAWHTPAIFAPGDAELDLAGSILGGGEASRLYKLLVVERQLAQSVSASQSSHAFSSTFGVTVTLRSEADLATVERLVEDELARLRDEPVSARELAQAVTRYEARAVRRLESLLARAELLQHYNHFLGEPDALTVDLDRYRNATPEGLREQVRRHLLPARQVTLVTRPKGGRR
jgi:zinc protease